MLLFAMFIMPPFVLNIINLLNFCLAILFFLMSCNNLKLELSFFFIRKIFFFILIKIENTLLKCRSPKIIYVLKTDEDPHSDVINYNNLFMHLLFISRLWCLPQMPSSGYVQNKSKNKIEKRCFLISFSDMKKVTVLHLINWMHHFKYNF